MKIEWNKDENGDWTLEASGEKVRYLTSQQKEDLENILEELKSEMEK